MTLLNLVHNPVFKVTQYFDAEYLINGYTAIVTMEGE